MMAVLAPNGGERAGVARSCCRVASECRCMALSAGTSSSTLGDSASRRMRARGIRPRKKTRCGESTTHRSWNGSEALTTTAMSPLSATMRGSYLYSGWNSETLPASTPRRLETRYVWCPRYPCTSLGTVLLCRTQSRPSLSSGMRGDKWTVLPWMSSDDALEASTRRRSMFDLDVCRS